MTDEIASLRASVERLTAERDEFKRIGQEFERDGRATFEQSCINLKRAESAEATIARLGMVVRAAHGVFNAAQIGPCGFHCPTDCRVMIEVVSPIKLFLSSLTPEDRRRVGIEG